MRFPEAKTRLPQAERVHVCAGTREISRQEAVHCEEWLGQLIAFHSLWSLEVVQLGQSVVGVWEGWDRMSMVRGVWCVGHPSECHCLLWLGGLLLGCC